MGDKMKQVCSTGGDHDARFEMLAYRYMWIL
jgi:hypothetical protein